MIRIFLTGDNHIGLKYASHEKAGELAQARILAFEGMVEAANEAGCGMFAITGDLFENTYGVAKKDVTALVELLGKFRGTVVVLPGNHDYYHRDAKVWQYFDSAIRDRDNILLIREYRPYEIQVGEERVVIWPAHCTAVHSAPGENNLGWMKDLAREPGAYYIGMAHGALEGETIDREGAYFLMTRQELEAIPVDVWLLGHTHVPFPRDLGENWRSGERIFNAGTHVQTDVACNTEGCCFVIELDGREVRAKKVVSGNLRFYRIPLRLEAGEMEDRLEAVLEPLADGSVVELELGGVVSAEEYERRAAVLEGLLGRFIEGSWRDHELSRLITRELIRREFPETSFAAAFLGALLAEPKEAQMAYELLKEMENGGRKK